MSLDTLTPDEFMQLTPADHAVAIYVYSQRITQLEKKVEAATDADTRDIVLDESRRCQNLRKLHLYAFCELEQMPVQSLTPVAA